MYKWAIESVEEQKEGFFFIPSFSVLFFFRFVWCLYMVLPREGRRCVNVVPHSAAGGSDGWGANWIYCGAGTVQSLQPFATMLSSYLCCYPPFYRNICMTIFWTLLHLMKNALGEKMKMLKPSPPYSTDRKRLPLSYQRPIMCTGRPHFSGPHWSGFHNIRTQLLGTGTWVDPEIIL